MSPNSHPETEKLDPRVRRTRQMLDQAFMELVNEKGFQAVNVQEITERAGVNRATFYAHFSDKFALLNYSIRESFRSELRKRLLDCCHASPENLRLLIVAVCEFVSAKHAHCTPPQSQFEASIETEIKNQIYDLLLNWLAGAGDGGAAEIAATAASWAIYGLASRWSHEKDKRTPEQFADQVLPLIATNLKLPAAAS